jgi:capsular exopolysaccharide synthesis family protein
MGDVFRAMNRAKQERQQQPSPQPAQEGDGAGPETPALPIEQVHDEAMRESAVETAARGAAPVPVRENRPAVPQPRSDDAEVIVPPPPRQPTNAELNGYAPQVVVHHDRGCIITEQYRAIRTQILARCRNRRVQVHVITSSAPQEGKTVTTINLGIAFSELRNQRTLLIEGDLRRPAFARMLARDQKPGLLHYLRGEVDEIDRILQPSVYDNLQIIPAGDREFTKSTELLSSPRMAFLLDRLRDRYDHIFIDTPPVITVTDGCILGAMADDTLLVVRLNRTPTDAVDRAKRLLRAANCEIAGCILTHMTNAVPSYLYRYV